MEKAIQRNINIIVRDFLHSIADRHNLSFEDLIKCQTHSTCLYKFSKGKNKGQSCPKKASENGYCGTHLKHSVSNIIGTHVKKTGGIKPMTKTQMQIIEWLNTAVPQDETVLKRRSKGLLHEETDMIFDTNYTVIGKLNGSEIVKLSRFEVEICDKRGWRYDSQIVDLDVDE